MIPKQAARAIAKQDRRSTGTPARTVPCHETKRSLITLRYSKGTALRI